MFFAELLEEYHRAGSLGEADAYARAQQLAYRLPPTLRQDVVFQLSGRLVASAVQLWQAVGDVLDPIVALNNQVPDWRLQLPLNADDATLHALLAPLLSRIGGLEQAANTGLRWRGLLREKTPGVWSIEKALDLPETLDSAVLCRWLNQAQDQPLAPRLRLILSNESDNETVAWLTRGRAVGGQVTYRREWLCRGGLRLSGHAVLAPYVLELQDGQTATALHARFAEPWIEDLPWVFVDKSGARVWHNQGATRTRAERAWVVTPGAMRPEIEAVDLCQCVGILDCLGFPVYEVRSAVDFESPSGTDTG
jgi:hypothetical protein